MVYLFLLRTFAISITTNLFILIAYLFLNKLQAKIDQIRAMLSRLQREC